MIDPERTGSELSELRMPRYVPPAHIEEPAAGPRGRIESFPFKSGGIEGLKRADVRIGG